MAKSPGNARVVFARGGEQSSKLFFFFFFVTTTTTDETEIVVEIVSFAARPGSRSPLSVMILYCTVGLSNRLLAWLTRVRGFW